MKIISQKQLSNTNLMKVCICGGGNLAQVIAAYLTSHQRAEVNVLTRNPQNWNHTIQLKTPDSEFHTGNIDVISDNPERALVDCDIVLLCVPGFANQSVLQKIKPYLKKTMFVGTVFSSTGFFFDAFEVLGNDIPLWGFQRVPFISRIIEYGKLAELKGYKKQHLIAVENTDKKEEFRAVVEHLFGSPTKLLSNYYEATFTNSNAILHPSHLYVLFKDWKPGVKYPNCIPFYDSWDVETSQLYIEMDEELAAILKQLPVRKDYLPSVLEYYESTDAQSLTNKILSIFGNQGFKSPMIEVEGGWIPDLNSRYFQEDFGCCLRFIYETGKSCKVNTPTIDRIYKWGEDLIKSNNS